MRHHDRNHPWGWCAGVLLFLHAIGSQATDGFSVAVRHAVSLKANSAPVVGNGEVGCLLRSSEASRTFLEGTLTGEHWKCFSPGLDTPAERALLLKFGVEVQAVDPAIPPLPGFLAGAVYRLDENLVANRFQTNDRILSATFTVSPTRNLFILSGKSSFPVNLKMTAMIPDPGLAGTSPFPASSCITNTSLSLALTQDLPRMESFGVAIHASGGKVQSATAVRGFTIGVQEARQWLILIRITSLQDNLPLLPITLAEARNMAATQEVDLSRERTGWWQTYWNQSLLDLQGSMNPNAVVLERAMVWLQHGLATHARGRFPPGDSGLGKPRSGGRPWHSTLWPLYRGWIAAHHSDEVNCLGYPLLIGEREKLTGTEALLASECGPDGIPALDSEALGEALMETGLVSEQYAWNENGRLFSTIPLLQSLPDMMRNRPEVASAVYPFLFRNANRAMEILSTTGTLAQLDPSLIPHLCLAVEGALEVADSIEIDAPTRRKWLACLATVRTQLGRGQDWPSWDEIRFLPDTLEGLGEVEGFLKWFSVQQAAPEGVLLNAAGGRSLLKTGWALGELIDLLVTRKEGVYHLLPGIPPDGTWSLQWENIGLEDGCTIPALTLDKGIMDSFLIRPAHNGPVRFMLPPNWTSAKVALIGPSQEGILVKISPERIAEFPGESGQDYLVGPVW